MVGRPPFDPALVLKMELVAYLYNLSERQVEVYIDEQNLPAKYFVGLAVDQKAPDHSTLTVFCRATAQARQVEGLRRHAGRDCPNRPARGGSIWFHSDRG